MSTFFSIEANGVEVTGATVWTTITAVILSLWINNEPVCHSTAAAVLQDWLKLILKWFSDFWQHVGVRGADGSFISRFVLILQYRFDPVYCCPLARWGRFVLPLIPHNRACVRAADIFNCDFFWPGSDCVYVTHGSGQARFSFLGPLTTLQ